MQEKELVRQLKDLKNIKPSQKWLNLTRYKLLEQIEMDSASLAQPSYFWSFFREPRTDALVACLLLIFAVGPWLSIKASQASLPGDFLYSLKRVGEGIQKAITSDENQSYLEIEFAYRRLDEFNRITDPLLHQTDVDQAKEVVTSLKNNLDKASVYADKITPERALTVAQKTKKIAETLDKAKEDSGLEGEISEAEESLKEINYHVLTVLAASQVNSIQATTTDEEIITFLEEETGTTTEEILNKEEIEE